MRTIKIILIFFIFILPSVLFGQGPHFYIAPDGIDTNPGTKEKPVASLNAARDRIREWKKKNQISDTVFVMVKGGQYFLKEPFVLENEDSGTKQFPVVYFAKQGASPVFNGGIQIRGFKKLSDGTWYVKIPEVKYWNWHFEQLYVNGRRAVRAKSPNQGYFNMKEIKEEVWVKGNGRAPERARQVVKVDPENIKDLVSLNKEDFNQVVLKVFHKWDITLRHLDKVSIDTEAVIYTSGGGMKPWNSWKPGQRYILENYAAALDAPGEWFLDSEGGLYYIPLEGEEPETVEVIAPVLQNLVIIRGRTSEGKFVENVQLRGLKFMYSAWNMPQEGFEPAQAASPIDASVQADAARNILIKNCEIAHTGNYGIWFRKACSNSIVEHCYIHDLGAGGVRMGETTIPENRELITRNISFTNNIIQSGSYIFDCAVGVWIGQSSDNRIEHNDIGNFRYTGVSVGWIWGYQYSPAKRNRILFNHIHHIGWGILSDMSGVYTLGSSEGTLVNNNVIHHIYSYSYGGWGLYPDEGSTGIHMENNLVYKTKTGGFHQHYGKENIIRNNIFAFSQKYQLQCTRVEKHRSFNLTNNIIYFTEGVVMAGSWDKIDVKVDSNIYWNPLTKEMDFAGMSFSKWRKTGHDSHSFVVDPYFTDPEKYDFSFRKKSSIRKIDFQAFDYLKAGVYGDKIWVDLAKLSPEVLEKFEKVMKEGTGK
jgi:hypothetical protein